jgi:hypothetical protein
MFLFYTMATEMLNTDVQIGRAQNQLSPRGIPSAGEAASRKTHMLESEVAAE